MTTIIHNLMVSDLLNPIINSVDTPTYPGVKWRNFALISLCIMWVVRIFNFCVCFLCNMLSSKCFHFYQFKLESATNFNQTPLSECNKTVAASNSSVFGVSAVNSILNDDRRLTRATFICIMAKRSPIQLLNRI